LTERITFYEDRRIEAGKSQITQWSGDSQLLLLTSLFFSDKHMVTDTEIEWS
jgi:hypothetical protein